MHARRAYGTKVEPTMVGHDELVAVLIIVTQEILTSTHVAKKRHDIAVSDGNKVRTSIVVADTSEAVVLDKLVKIFPGDQVLRPKQ